MKKKGKRKRKANVETKQEQVPIVNPKEFLDDNFSGYKE